MENILNLLDVDFYQVEKDCYGHSLVHSNGYCYKSEDGYDPEGNISQDYCYRLVEYCGLYLEPEKLRNEEDYYNLEQEKVKQYISDITEEECRNVLRDWLKGRFDTIENGIVTSVYHGCTALPMEDVTDDTPEGWYVDCKEVASND